MKTFKPMSVLTATLISTVVDIINGNYNFKIAHKRSDFMAAAGIVQQFRSRTPPVKVSLRPHTARAALRLERTEMNGAICRRSGRVAAASEADRLRFFMLVARQLRLSQLSLTD
jgi:hypothetical protein